MRITINESDPAWAEVYEAERDRLKEVLGPMAAQIEHIGSTAVPGLAAKPVVDIQVGLKNLAEFDNDSGVNRLENAGYAYLPHFEAMVPFRRLFTRDIDGVRQNNLHVVAQDHPWFQRHTIFRDYLRINDGARNRYEDTKRELAENEWQEVNDYAGAKSAIVITIEEEAFQHYKLPAETRAWLRTSRIS